MRPMRIGAFVLILLLSACGQAGDLYLPSEPAATPAPAPAPTPAPPATPEEKKKETK